MVYLDIYLSNESFEKISAYFSIKHSNAKRIYILMAKGFMYLVTIIDVHCRFIIGWDIYNSMEASWVVETLKKTIDWHGSPQIINSDQGSQFTSTEYII